VITVVIPSIPSRAKMLDRALASVKAQTLRPERVVVEFDDDRLGAAATRQRGLEKVTTPWVAFLDDDDEFLPGHLYALFWTASL
jgi:glycosyltransferase involved in cell wall biosynthesis